ncbi:hypothetical protein HNI00_16115 [Thermoleptolyngbya oregonensis NK1-22]|uniref:Uncharacterized protein n=1 Tax=Thermoleptolyngbya oregonensis NK1-22 TaxID=2547457 RepID=A0AA96Y6F4_9CYAN|nr:hypothetical protein [Thermoleptolyngbya oregonensis]WOB44504.1 hypothetical protein HNI00_16115 [Thermoleptolyngbya oregonensis NK1-22]
MIELLSVTPNESGFEALISDGGTQNSYQFSVEEIDLNGQPLQLIRSDKSLFEKYKFEQGPYFRAGQAVKRVIAGEEVTFPVKLDG